MTGKPELSIGELDNGLLSSIKLAVTGGAPLPRCRFVTLLTSLGDVDVLKADRFVNQYGDAIRKSLHESFARCQLETRTRAVTQNVGAQHARLQCSQERRMTGQNAFFTFGRHRDDELRVAFEENLGRRHQLEWNDASHVPSVRRSLALPR